MMKGKGCMIVDIIGFTTVDYVSKRDGHVVKGVNVFALEKISKNGDGFRYVGSFNNGSYKPLFISDSLYPVENFRIGKYDVDISLTGAINNIRYIDKN